MAAAFAKDHVTVLEESMRQELSAERAKAASKLQEEAARVARQLQAKEAEFKEEIARLRSASARDLDEKVKEISATREASFQRELEAERARMASTVKDATARAARELSQKEAQWKKASALRRPSAHVLPFGLVLPGSFPWLWQLNVVSPAHRRTSRRRARRE